MDFEPFSTIDLIRIGIENYTECIIRDTFSVVDALYDSKKNCYELLKNEKDFENKKAYKKYISENTSKICKLYMSDYVQEDNQLGTLLFDFLKYDFSDFDSYCKFVRKYGVPAICSYSSSGNKRKNPFSNCSTANVANNNENIFYTENDFIKVCKKNYKDKSESLIFIQSFFERIIRFINNIDNFDYLKNFSIAERFYIYQRADLLNYFGISTMLFIDTTVSYGIDFMKDFDISLINFTDDFNQVAKSLSKDMKSNPKDYNRKPSLFITFNCPIIETACLITIFHIIQNNIQISICKNCGNYFIPTSKKNTLYCNNLYEKDKTCQDIGAMITYNEKLKKDEITSLYRKTLSAKKMLANRNPDIPMYLQKYEQWKNEANEFRKKIKQGIKTENEFKNWIEETRKNY